jgi:hypothetical protein
MIAPRVLTTVCLLLPVGLLACASTGPPRVWDEFSPTYANFERHFDERGQDLDPIEGIWSAWEYRTAQPDSFIIVRDTSFSGYDFVGVRTGAVTSGTQAGFPPHLLVEQVSFSSRCGARQTTNGPMSTSMWQCCEGRAAGTRRARASTSSPPTGRCTASGSTARITPRAAAGQEDIPPGRRLAQWLIPRRGATSAPQERV